ncbi:MAG TPA: CPBP family intramembrane glutamic endopeptidase [Chitinophagaceae bacterium]|nr:CPBP family intramembrane glutamic endopeptidase [Chitinophagaceae bacterium]
MQEIVGYIHAWWRHTDKKVLWIVTLFTAVLIFLNYWFDLDPHISAQNSFGYSFVGRFLIFYLAFVLPYLAYRFAGGKPYPSNARFVYLLFFAPALFSLKVALDLYIPLSEDEYRDHFWNYVLYWPVLVAIVSFILYLNWLLFDRGDRFYGLSRRNLQTRPYLVMLLMMVPLIAAASTRPEFLYVYPRLNAVAGVGTQVSWWEALLFELSYGSDFFTIELFFRGFLILGFARWAGRDAILPMACFYCTIHFGKPLGECISSYFGGIILGIVVYHTRSIYGGLLVHLGIAWLMELGGYLGNYFR